MRTLLILFINLIFFASTAVADNLEKLFYITSDKHLLNKINEHANSINIIAPQIYRLNQYGSIAGNIDPNLLTVAKENNIKIMPLVMNADFNQDQFHRFLHSSFAQSRAIDQMITLCEQHRYYGLQFDFENIHAKDRDALTRFFQTAANKLHQYGFKISIAVVPRASESFNNSYDRWLYENWSGAYDYQALAESADFISIMSYDLHTNLTTPGPIAAVNWVEKIIQHLLKTVPAEKISLGIPDYSGYWTTGSLNPKKSIPEEYAFRSREFQIGYTKTVEILNTFNQSPIWNKQWQSSYVMYTNDERNEFLFVEDARSFQAKLELARRYHLRGISVWRLGLEDPRIWNNVNLG